MVSLLNKEKKRSHDFHTAVSNELSFGTCDRERNNYKISTNRKNSIGARTQFVWYAANENTKTLNC